MTYESVKGHTPFINHLISSKHNLHHKLLNVNYDNYPYIFVKYIFKTYRDYKAI